jgi:hypothetical protein
VSSSRRPTALRLIALLPAAAFLATFGVFFVDKNRQARTVLGSGRGLLTVAAIVGGYLTIGFVLRRLRWAWLAPVVLTTIVLGLAAWIVRPYYVDETANRQLVTGPVRNASDPPPTEPSEPAPQPGQQEPPGPVRIGAGSLQGIDHEAAGTAALLRTADLSYVVRLETFDIEGSPDPQVYLVAGEDVRDPGGVALGRLPGNVGTVLDIAVPDGTDAGPGWTLLVWCGRFAVPIANATLSAT